MQRKTDEEVFAMLDYLAWRSHCRFGDFIEHFAANGITLFGWPTVVAQTYARDAVKSLDKRGLVETYQEYIADEDFCKVLAVTINSGSLTMDV